MKTSSVAAFDFDGTLIPFDAFIPFLLYVKGAKKVSFAFIKLVPTLIFYIVGICSRQGLKEKLLSFLIANDSIATLRQQAQTFTQDKIIPRLKSDMLKRVEWHRDQGHLLVMISANIDLVIDPVAKHLHFDHALSSQLEIENNCPTGRLSTKNCRCQEKVERLTALLGSLSDVTIYAYGDSAGDKELLSIATYPTRV